MKTIVAHRMLQVLAVSAAAACASPEAQRVRGGGAGADPGNRDPVVEMHGGSRVYYDTPCLTTLEECRGPLPVSGLTEREPASR